MGEGGFEGGGEELLYEPEFYGFGGVAEDGDHHYVEHALVEVAGGDGEDVDVCVFWALLLCETDGGEEGGGEFASFREVVLRGARFSGFFEDIFGFHAGVAREAWVEGFALEGHEGYIGAVIAGLGVIALLAGAIDSEDLGAAARLELELPVAWVGFELEVAEIGHYDSVGEVRIFFCSEVELHTSRGRASGDVSRMPFDQDVLEFVDCVDVGAFF